eukprot:2648837-Ditylum_brightwellii.AAC.1
MSGAFSSGSVAFWKRGVYLNGGGGALFFFSVAAFDFVTSTLVENKEEEKGALGAVVLMQDGEEDTIGRKTSRPLLLAIGTIKRCSIFLAIKNVTNSKKQKRKIRQSSFVTSHQSDFPHFFPLLIIDDFHWLGWVMGVNCILANKRRKSCGSFCVTYRYLVVL